MDNKNMQAFKPITVNTNKSNKNLTDQYETIIWREEKGASRHYISANKEWKNSAYFYGKNSLKEVSNKDGLLSRLTKSSFNLTPSIEGNTKSKRMRDLIKRSSTNKLFSSKPEVKHTNDKAFVTIYVYDSRKRHLIKKLYFWDRLFVNYKYRKNLLFTKLKNIRKRKIRFLRRRSLKRYRFKLLKLYNLRKKLLNITRYRYFNYYNEWKMRFLNITLVTNINNKPVIKYPSVLNSTSQNNENKSLVNSFNTIKLKGLTVDKLKHINKRKQMRIRLIVNRLITILFFSHINVLANKFFDLSKMKQNFIQFYKNKIKELKQVPEVNKKSEKLVTVLNKQDTKSMLAAQNDKKPLNLVEKINKNTKNSRKAGNVKDTKKTRKEVGLLKSILNINKLLVNQCKPKNYMSSIKHLLENLFSKKVILNVVNLKYLHLNSDNYMEAISVKLAKKKTRLLRILRKSIRLVRLPKSLKIKARNSKMLLNTIPTIESIKTRLDRNSVLNNISYKWTTGVRLEAKGRLTRRFTASRALFKFKYKGSLKNLEPSNKVNDIKKSPSIFMVRGNIRPNLQHTFVYGKKRIGAFGLKGWLSNN